MENAVIENTEFSIKGRQVEFAPSLDRADRVRGYVSDIVILPAEPGFKPQVELLIIDRNGGVHQKSLRFVKVVM